MVLQRARPLVHELMGRKGKAVDASPGQAPGPLR
jgi:hypothetical protein